MVRLAHSYSAIKQYENCPLQYKMQRVTKEVKPTFGEASIYGNRIHEQLEVRLRDNVVLPKESAKYEKLCSTFEQMQGTVIAEQEMTLNQDLTPTGWWDKDAWLRSKLDVMVHNDDHATIADWKTGKRRPDFFQLELFTLQTFVHYPDVVDVTALFVWLKDMNMDSVRYNREEAPALWANLMGKIKRIEKSLADDNWPAKPSGLCPWCPAFQKCEYAR